MTIYEHTSSVTVSAGSVASVTLRVLGGLCQQVLVRANTATTVFRANMQDDNSITRMDWGFHTGELNDIGLNFPMVGRYTFNITNANPNNDTFRILLAVQEK